MSFTEDCLREKREAFRGSIKSWIQNIECDHFHDNPRQTDHKNVNRLLQIYKLEGCSRLEPAHRVPVLVQRSILDRALRASEIACLEDSAEPPFLVEDIRVFSLHGKHRLEAAKRYLAITDQWWVVDLYEDTLSERTRHAIQEEYSNASNFCDGDIYRHIQYCCEKGDKTNEGRWLARLSPSKRTDLFKLRRMADRDNAMRDFKQALDGLVTFPGLWPAMQLGTFHRLLTLRCPEEMTHYLLHTRAVWDSILRDDSLRQQLDSDTVRVLQGRCLRYSSNDRLVIETLMAQGKLFSRIRDDHAKQEILDSLRSLKCIIPSLHTFLEDTKYIEPCAKIIKSLLPTKFQGSIKGALTSRHNGQLILEEQIAENEFVASRAKSSAEALRTGYLQLWLFAFRHFPQMSGQAPRKDTGKPKPELTGIERGRWPKMTTLATKSGFHSLRLNQSNVVDADVTMAQAFLHLARPKQQYLFDEGVFNTEVQRICTTLRGIPERSSLTENPPVASNDEHDHCGSDITFRCGRPFERAFLQDRKYLFLRYVYRKQENVELRRYLTTFLIKRDIFRAFFGNPTLDTQDDGSSVYSTDPLEQRLSNSPSSLPVGRHTAFPSLSHQQDINHDSHRTAQSSGSTTIGRQYQPLGSPFISELLQQRSQILEDPQPIHYVLQILIPAVDVIDDHQYSVKLIDQTDIEATLRVLKAHNVKYFVYNSVGHLKSLRFNDIVRKLGQSRLLTIIKTPATHSEQVYNAYKTPPDNLAVVERRTLISVPGTMHRSQT